jgi:RNA polymerase sigma-70 factor (ECF subfamily)
MPVLNVMGSKEKRFEALVRALSGDLYRYAFWLCRQRSLAEDLVQETFARAWKSLHSLQDDKAAKSWLITILRREHARLYERKQLDTVELDELRSVGDLGGSPDQDTERQLLRRAILDLDEEYREPLLLQVVGGFSGEEIANMLGLERATVNTRLFRARSKLKELFDHDIRKVAAE